MKRCIHIREDAKGTDYAKDHQEEGPQQDREEDCEQDREQACDHKPGNVGRSHRKHGRENRMCRLFLKIVTIREPKYFWFPQSISILAGFSF